MPTLTIWGELVELMHGVHGYGSDVAEIYAYRFLPYSPASVQVKGINLWEASFAGQRPLKYQAAIAAIEIFNLFEKTYKVSIEVKTEDDWQDHASALQGGFCSSSAFSHSPKRCCTSFVTQQPKPSKSGSQQTLPNDFGNSKPDPILHWN